MIKTEGKKTPKRKRERDRLGLFEPKKLVVCVSQRRSVFFFFESKKQQKEEKRLDAWRGERRWWWWVYGGIPMWILRLVPSFSLSLSRSLLPTHIHTHTHRHKPDKYILHTRLLLAPYQTHPRPHFVFFRPKVLHWNIIFPNLFPTKRTNSNDETFNDSAQFIAL